ncbi:hypothetical protein [Rathayibacter sp. VKM Ac-2760]|uniref:hypothetical protein n=1 Tax=Rathayibacter sp. VKM Ac-2760 TaxID=2609253 RepID=UPI0013171847|nr:hypothetical protein [Rathayibacter sp. VKM Ac-2760]QHC59121.1 hypothetical protein GSU72_11555 [Rathayibacter sp. VKM Ac-2760]
MSIPASDPRRDSSPGRAVVVSLVLSAALAGGAAPLAHAEERESNALSQQAVALRPAAELVVPGLHDDLDALESEGPQGLLPDSPSVPGGGATASAQPAIDASASPELAVTLLGGYDLGRGRSVLEPGETVPVGTPITSTFVIRNAGAVAVTVGSADGGPAVLEPGDEVPIAGPSRLVTEEDVRAGSVTLTGTVDGSTAAEVHASSSASLTLATAG